MKAVGVAILVILFAGGYLAYQNGTLAQFHPLLDPKAAIESDSIQADDERETTASNQGKAGEKRNTREKSDSDQKSMVEASQKEDARNAVAENARLAREELAAKRKEDAENRKAEEISRRAIDRQIAQEIEILNTQYLDLQNKIGTANENLAKQEGIWRNESIKTREVERQKVRDASKSYVLHLRTQMSLIEAQIAEKRKQRR